MTATLGDFLTIAGQRITAASQRRLRGHLTAAAHAEITAELGHLLTVIARHASEGLHPGDQAATPVPTKQELTVLGIRLTLLHAADSVHPATQTTTPGSTSHSIAADLRAAADALIAGHDLVRTHVPGSPDAADPLWAPALTARPVTAALMRELSGYASHLARLTSRLARKSADGVPVPVRQALQEASRWLTLAAAAHKSDPDQPGLDLNRLLLHSIPADLPPPRQPPADRDQSPAELCAGATATAARLRHLAIRANSQPPWPSPSAAASWRHNALATAIITHTSELLLTTLAERARQLTLPEHHQQTLHQTADTIRRAWQSCQAVTRAWDRLTTGTSSRLSLMAAELDDLVLWIGRLARTGTWTPARAHAGQPRPPLDLARTPSDLTVALVTIARTTDATAHILRQDMHSAEQAAAAGWIYSPARHLPESDDLVHIYRYNHASPGQIAGLRAAYHHAITTTERVTTTLDALLTDLCTPGEPHALARALQHNPLTPQPLRRNARPLSSNAVSAADPGPSAGDIEHLLHHLKVTDPELLFRAIALDHATRDLTAEALTKSQELTRITEAAWPCHACQSAGPRNRSARLAAQDRPADSQARHRGAAGVATSAAHASADTLISNKPHGGQQWRTR